MARIAKKKGIDNKAGYVVKPIAVKDIEKQADFGTFKITRTRECIAYTNYVGYSVITKPYTTTPEGQATKLSLYEWLNYALEMQEYLTEHKDEKNPDLDMTNGAFSAFDRESLVLEVGESKEIHGKGNTDHRWRVSGEEGIISLSDTSDDTVTVTALKKVKKSAMSASGNCALRK